MDIAVGPNTLREAQQAPRERAPGCTAPRGSQFECQETKKLDRSTFLRVQLTTTPIVSCLWRFGFRNDAIRSLAHRQSATDIMHHQMGPSRTSKTLSQQNHNTRDASIHNTTRMRRQTSPTDRIDQKSDCTTSQHKWTAIRTET